MTTTWTIAIDWDRNGNYGNTYDDVTSHVISANWFLGMRQAYQEIADNSTLTLVLDNTDKRYSPENSGSPLHGQVVPFRPIRIQSNNDSEVRTHWQGWVESIQPAVNQYGKRVVQMVATGSMQFLKAAETNIELQENKRTDEIIASLVREVVFPPSLARAWVLERVGNSELGETTGMGEYVSGTTFLANTSGFLWPDPEDEDDSLYWGRVTLQMAGDNWVRQGGLSNVKKDSFNVYQAINDVVAAEHGKFVFDREGKAYFWNRHHLLKDPVVVATFDDSMTEMAYTYAGLEHVKNEVIVVSHPRTITDSDQEVLWELGDAVIRVDAGETREVYVKYKDEGDSRVGAKDVTVGDLEFDRGTASATVEANANGANLIFENSGNEVAVITKCVVRGRKITDFGEMEAKAIDNASIVDYGRRTLRINLPSIDDLEQAQYIADFERDRRGQPWGAVNALTVLSHGKNGGGHHVQQLDLTLGDLINIQETQTGHDREHYIIGETHELSQGATFWKTTWYLEVAPEEYPWKLPPEEAEDGYRLNVDTRLAY